MTSRQLKNKELEPSAVQPIKGCDAGEVNRGRGHGKRDGCPVAAKQQPVDRQSHQHHYEGLLGEASKRHEGSGRRGSPNSAGAGEQHACKHQKRRKHVYACNVVPSAADSEHGCEQADRRQCRGDRSALPSYQTEDQTEATE